MTNLPREVKLIIRDIERVNGWGILWALLFLGGSAGESAIGVLLGRDRGTIRKRCRDLAHIELITRTHYHAGWTLSGSGRQLVLNWGDSHQLNPANIIVNPQKPLKEDPIIITATDANHTSDPAVIEELRLAKIIGKKAQDLAALEWVTVDYVRRLAKEFQKEQAADPRKRTGILVTWIEEHRPVQETKEEYFRRRFAEEEG